VDDKPGRAGAGAPPELEEPPARAAAYIPPMAVPKESRYHTIDMKAVRLSPDIDPQRMKTQLSLRAVPAVAERRRPSRRLPAWLALLLVGGALGTCVWWFARWRNVRGDSVIAASIADATPAASIASSNLGSRGLPAAASTPVGVASANAGLASSVVVPELANVDALPNAEPAASWEPPKAAAPRTAAPSPRVQTRPTSVKVSPAPRKKCSRIVSTWSSALCATAIAFAFTCFATPNKN